MANAKWCLWSLQSVQGKKLSRLIGNNLLVAWEFNGDKCTLLIPMSESTSHKQTGASQEQHHCLCRLSAEGNI